MSLGWKRATFWVGAVALLGALAVLVFYNPKLDVSFTETQANTAIDAKIPMNISKHRISYTIADADVQFLANGNIALQGTGTATIAGRSATADIDVEGAVDYRNGSFYLTDMAIHDVTMRATQLLPGDTTLLDGAKALVDGFIQRNDNAAGQLAAATEVLKQRFVPWAQDAVLERLASVPLYTLGGDVKQNLARLALEDVQVSEETLTVTLSVGELLKNLLLGAVALLAAVAITFALFSSGTTGGAVAIVGLGLLGGS